MFAEGENHKVLSDNGTNFVGADNELRAELKRLEADEVEKHMVQQHVDWAFNPPLASHRGGAWERMVRATKSILKSLIQS